MHAFTCRYVTAQHGVPCSGIVGFKQSNNQSD